MDQLEGPDHIGGFVRVRIRFDVTQPLMRGAFVEFLEEGNMLRCKQFQREI